MSISDNKFSQKLIFICAKLIVTAITVGYLIHLFLQNPNIYDQTINSAKSIVNGANYFWLILPCLLVPVNWGLEAYKWKYLAAKVEKLSFAAAAKGVLTGLTLGFITPHSLGDYVARVYFMRSENKREAIGAVLIARISQFYITLFYGVAGFIITYQLFNFETGFFNHNIILFFTFSCVLCLFLLLNFNLVLASLSKIPILNKIVPYLEVISAYSMEEFTFVFGVSLMRYIVFTLQYILLLYFFGANIFNVLILAAIWLVFFTKSIFPSFNFLNDVGVREAAALYFLGNIGMDPAHIILASLSLWVINILIPTMVGLTIILASRYSA